MPAPPPNASEPPAGDLEPKGVVLLKGLSSRREVAEILGVTWQQLAWLLYRNGRDGHYRTWTIRKRHGQGTREIRSPRAALARVQGRLLPILQDAYKPRSAAHAYVNDRSVRTNAEPHVRSKYVLNVDLVDFFPSVHFGRVRGLFLAEPFSCDERVATVLAQICCSNGRLPIGACTSPLISNMICRRLDRELQELARAHGCKYTRYADDITFSTRRLRLPRAIAETAEDGSVTLGEDLSDIIRTNGFNPNQTKTRLQRSFDRQLVAGVVVNERLNVDRRYIRNIRAMLHNWSTQGLEAVQVAFIDRFDTKDRYPGATPEFQRVLRGRIAYLAMIRGKDDIRARVFLDQFDNLKAGRPLNHGINYLSYQPPDSPAPLHRREVSTIMFTDVVDSTFLATEMGDEAWQLAMTAHFGRVRTLVSRHGGNPIKTMGDGTLATFPSPSAAIHCAHAIVRREADEGIQVRIGLHTGEIARVPEEDDITGLGVAFGARVGGKAESGEVWVSDTVKDVVMGGPYEFEDRGEHELKGFGLRQLFVVIPKVD